MKYKRAIKDVQLDKKKIVKMGEFINDYVIDPEGHIWQPKGALLPRRSMEGILSIDDLRKVFCVDENLPSIISRW